MCLSVIFHPDFVERGCSDKEADLHGSVWTRDLQQRSERDHCCQESVGVWQVAKKYDVRACMILECGASGLSVGVEITQEERECVRKEDRKGEEEYMPKRETVDTGFHMMTLTICNSLSHNESQSLFQNYEVSPKTSFFDLSLKTLSTLIRLTVN